jgi:phosphoglycolate phosphatase-like HAD superfamily hydrolase
MRFYLATSKREAFARRILEHLELAAYFGAPWIKIDRNASPPEESESGDHEISQYPISGTSFAA